MPETHVAIIENRGDDIDILNGFSSVVNWSSQPDGRVDGLTRGEERKRLR